MGDFFRLGTLYYVLHFDLLRTRKMKMAGPGAGVAQFRTNSTVETVEDLNSKTHSTYW